MSFTTNNSPFAGGKPNAQNFAGTSFSKDASLAAPQIGGKGKSAANSDWIATIYSKEVLMEFRTASVVESITNNDYYGEISDYGDSVIIIKEPDIDIVDYARGQKLESQAIDADSLKIVLDQAKAFQFQVDDIEKKLAHNNWQSLASGRAAYRLKDEFDLAILNYMADNMTVKNIIASTAGETAIASKTTGAAAFLELAKTGANVMYVHEQPKEADVLGGKAIKPVNLLNKFNLKLDLAEVPEEGRWVVVDPEFIEVAMREDSNVLNREYNDGKASIKNGLMNLSGVRGLKMYKTNNAPKLVTSTRPQTDGKLNDTGRIILAGHMSAVATVSAIVKTESFRSQQTFADVVRGLHVYGRAVIRPESLTAAAVTYQPVSA